VAAAPQAAAVRPLLLAARLHNPEPPSTPAPGPPAGVRRQIMPLHRPAQRVLDGVAAPVVACPHHCWPHLCGCRHGHPALLFAGSADGQRLQAPHAAQRREGVQGAARPAMPGGGASWFLSLPSLLPCFLSLPSLLPFFLRRTSCCASRSASRTSTGESRRRQPRGRGAAACWAAPRTCCRRCRRRRWTSKVELLQTLILLMHWSCLQRWLLLSWLASLHIMLYLSSVFFSVVALCSPSIGYPSCNSCHFIMPRQLCTCKSKFSERTNNAPRVNQSGNLSQNLCFHPSCSGSGLSSQHQAW
jgi:hypothetical protein